MRIYAVMLFLHVLTVVIWVGGIFLMHFAVRPSAVLLLPPPQRQPLLAAVLGRFFFWVAISAAVVLASGLLMIMGLGAASGAIAAGKNAFAEGFRIAHVSVHLMTALGLAMIALFLVIRFVPYPRLQRAVAAQDWPAGGRALDSIRLLVAINLILGVLTIAAATIGRAVI